MADCEKLAKCPFFTDQMTNMPSIAALMKQNYCQSDKTECARYRISSAGLAVPPDLLPNDTEHAEVLLKRR